MRECLRKLRPWMKLINLKFVELKVEVLYYDDRYCVPKFGEHRLNIMNNLYDI